MRAKSVLVMGGAVDVPGNMTPMAEFNIFGDPTAAARVFALTSPNPATTMPPIFHPISKQEERDPSDPSPLPSYPPREELGERRLNLILFPLDITSRHQLRRDELLTTIKPLLEKGSPLAEWTNAFLGSLFRTMQRLKDSSDENNAHLELHDPLCVWYAISQRLEPEEWSIKKQEDIRVETTGQWTRGACIVDRRDRKKREGEKDEGIEVPGDSGGWLTLARGNRLSRCIGTPGERKLGPLILETLFGSST